MILQTIFLGSYFRYYIDTQKESNAITLQELPKLQAHTYARPFVLDKLLYSTDLKYTNHTRNDGLRANQYELNIPISYSFSFFDDYLKLIAKQEFSFNKFEYNNDTNTFKDGTYAETNTIISLNTDLVKAYDDYIHTLNLSADYKHSKELEKDGDLYRITNNSSTLSPFSVAKSSDSINLGLNQSFYDRTSLKQIVNHKLSQSILYDEFDNAKFQNMENEIVYNYMLGAVKNRLVYNFQDDKLIESSSSFSLTYDNFYMKLGHYMSKDTPNSGKEELSSYQFNTKYKISDEYSIGYNTDYNIEKKHKNKTIFGILNFR